MPQIYFIRVLVVHRTVFIIKHVAGFLNFLLNPLHALRIHTSPIGELTVLRIC